MTRVASIDIGTNTILLLVADWEAQRVHPVFDTETTVRLGEGLHKTGLLSQEAMGRGVQTLRAYKERCFILNVQKVFAVGTSALRQALNTQEFLSMIKKELDISIEVISEEEEARCSYLAVAKELETMEEPLWVIDVGGGSTEFILGRKDHVETWLSLPLGAVGMTEEFLHSDPVREAEWDEMITAIREKLAAVPRSDEPSRGVAVGGTATTLAAVEQGVEAFAPDNIHCFVLTQEALKRGLDLLRSKPLPERKKIPGLPPARADVILAGAAILYEALKKLECTSLRVSCRGVRYGILYQRLSRNEPG
jgi:exopolyphosphatase/guanosine-5'-triphosphate,3'-diphosphate pyrophosphatase